MVCWECPSADWFKSHVDGARSHTIGRSAAGGVRGDVTGQWITGFMHHLGDCSSLTAELWGIMPGLKLAWENGIRKVAVESGSIIAVKDQG